ncbi:DUF3365 domain-containing protein [Thiohalophilus sp.]|uniref:Tll0287-like domain-containing protein n=1 Tax=Thiohalophilus sp. TaxID=3028392 RepID=UPI002ACD79EA|nr:DUF3365 domain-containing protein [Thiohalophilus sp.]MDZ7661917.1 DUF3365 domain-containing protein [Thiohalophilus sp.]MDZ7803784.1 DUF3365 domain-containing protein [Thiohalophilus sp.]
MKYLVSITLMAMLAGPAIAEQSTEHVEQSRAAVQQFFGQLKGELQAGMKAGGPVNAIEVCSDKAPAIARDVSKDKGLQIGRTSLKPRNPGNAPDQWEEAVLREFEQRKADGEHPKKMEKHAIVEQNGQQVFRYMKAIPTGELCLKCHGTQLDPAVSARLEKLYPEDRATGYSQGDLRGAFTISKNL